LMRILLDSSVLIDVLRDRKSRRRMLAELTRAGHALATSSLNVAEVYAGMRRNEKARTDALLDNLECYDLTAASGKRAGTLKQQWAERGRTLTLDDTMIAAIAIDNDCTLMTDNRKDFPMPEVSLYPLDTSRDPR